MFGASAGAGALALLAAAASLVLGARRHPGPALAALALALAAGGWAWADARIGATAPAPLEAEGEASAALTLLEAPVPTARGARARAEVERVVVGDREALPRGARVLLDLPANHPELEEGERVRSSGPLTAAPRPDAPAWWNRWLARNGISARLRVEAVRVVGRRGGARGARDRWRGWARAHAGAGLSGDTGALVRGMLLGGGTELSERASDEFRRSGLWHLLAVSGQNVTVVAIAVLAALRALLVPRRAALVVAAGAIAAYCLACDGGPSVTRAGLMGGLGLSAGLGGLPRQRWYLALLSLAVVLAARPRDVGDPGLQLSFAAVAGLYAIAPVVADRLDGAVPRRVAELVATALAAGLATAPVLAWHFGELSVIGLGLNVVAVPLAGPVVVLALISLAATPLGMVAAAPAALAGLGADTLLAGARLASAVPGASITVPRGAALALLVLCPAIVALLRFAPLERLAHRPRRAPVMPIAVTATAAAALFVLAAWSQERPPQQHPVEGTVLSVLDVGQGQAVLVRDPDGGAALLDAGPAGSPTPVVAALRAAGVERLGAVLVSHDAEDHSGGLPRLLRALRVERVIAPASAGEALAIARAEGVPAATAVQGQSLRLGATTLAVRWPRPGFRSAEPNDASLVVEVRGRGLSALVPGDAESPILGRLGLAPVDVLVLAHHGSADAGLPRLLSRLRPQIAVASAGRRNRHGHPAPDTVASIAAAGVNLLRTDHDGTVTLGASP